MTKVVSGTSGADPLASADPVTAAPAYASTETVQDPAKQTVVLAALSGVKLWEMDRPQLYTVHVRLLQGGKVVDEDTRKIGFREAMFTDQSSATIIQAKGKSNQTGSAESV